MNHEPNTKSPPSVRATFTEVNCAARINSWLHLETPCRFFLDVSPFSRRSMHPFCFVALTSAARMIRRKQTSRYVRKSDTPKSQEPAWRSRKTVRGANAVSIIVVHGVDTCVRTRVRPRRQRRVTYSGLRCCRRRANTSCRPRRQGQRPRNVRGGISPPPPG